MALDRNFQDKIAYIKSRWDCIRYASNVLGWPVHKDGDRYLSLAPGSTNTTALILHLNNWHDFKTGWFGDVIDLCARARHDGDKGAAIRELGEGFQGTWDESKWKAKTQDLCNKIEYWHKNLRPEDIEYLHSRNINDETIDRLKLGYDNRSQRLIIPYFKNEYVAYWAGRDRMPVPPQYIYKTGNPADSWLVQTIISDSLRENKKLPDGIIINPAYLDYVKLKRSKYYKAALDGYNENIPWGLHTLSPNFRKSKNAKLCERLPNADKILCILEGAFDVLSFEQEGFLCLSPIGGYFNSKVNQFVIDTAKAFDYVFICFDSDKPGSTFNLRMAELMFENRIPFKIGRLPKGIKDVSDYYCQTPGGMDLTALVRDAEDGITALAKSYTDKNEFKRFIYKAARFIDKPDLAQLFVYLKDMRIFDNVWLKALQSECSKAPSEKIIVDEITRKYLIKYIEAVGFYVYDNHGTWRMFPDNVIKNIIAEFLGIFANGGKLNTTLTLLKAKTVTREEFNKQPVVNFPNGVLDLETGELKEHSASYMCSAQMSYNYDPNAQCPKWDKFTSEIMDDNQAKNNLLHESLGYILCPDCRFQKCFIYQGDGANGKSVVIYVAGKLFGDDLCSYVGMSMLSSPFDPIRLYPSWVNFMAETDTNIKDAEARFKALVAGDRISAAYKGKDAIEFASRAKHIMSTNLPIQSNDTSRGLFRRIIFIAFNQTFEGKDANKNLPYELCEELPGIFNRVYEAYKRLMTNQEFTYTEEHAEMMRDFIEMTDPVEAFFNEEVEKYAGVLTSQEIYSKYSEWCKSAGRIAQSRHKFFRSFKIIIQRKKPWVSITRNKSGYVVNFDELPF